MLDSNLLGLLLVAGIVGGIKLMSSPKTAVEGNLLGAVCMAGAIILTLVSNQIVSLPILWVGMLIGSVLGYMLAVKVAMIQMPQMVALLNGLGGGSSAIVSWLVLLTGVGTIGVFERFTAAVGLAVGAVTLSGSLIATAKLSGKMKSKPTVLKNHSVYNFFTLLLTVLLVILITAGVEQTVALSVLAMLLTLFFGVLFTIRVGGADMPVTISLLNSLSGLAGAISGFAINNPLLVAVGSVVGASGLILTQIMCKAMNRSLMNVLTGKTALQAQKAGGSTAKKEVSGLKKSTTGGVAGKDSTTKNLAAVLAEAKKVIVVPGYGMALGQAQAKVKQVVDRLEEQGKEVKFAIHPVAGRMPGHMNVLLAEVNVEYEKLYELQAINPEFKETDLVIVIGANDVVNPAANTAEGTPIYGMPILQVDEAKHVIIMNMDTKPGYAGVDNPLYKSPKATLLLGDANQSLTQLLQLMEKNATQSEQSATGGEDLATILAEAKKVIVVPGYGMALGQAQAKVKQVVDRLEEQGKEVKFAIHPVAGRMPGHMNVLLAEVNVEYEKLYELQAINPEFKETDLVIVIGANDVVNPAANTAEGTPIYGMPILQVDEAKHVIIMNMDTKPGYAGVDNPLYKSPKATLLLGDANESLTRILQLL